MNCPHCGIKLFENNKCPDCQKHYDMGINEEPDEVMSSLRRLKMAEKELTEKEKEKETIEEARKVMTADTVDKLVTLANNLDIKGLTKEAAIIDKLLAEYYGPCTDCEKDEKSI